MLKNKTYKIHPALKGGEEDIFIYRSSMENWFVYV